MINVNQLINFIKHASSSSSTKKKRKDMIKSLNNNSEIESKVFHFNENCSICYEFPKDAKVITPCKHLFCHDCLGTWMKSNRCCPVCKREFE